MCNEFFLLKGETLIDFINTNTRKSIPIDFIKEKAYKINEKYIPRLDYLKVIDDVYFNGGCNEKD